MQANMRIFLPLVLGFAASTGAPAAAAEGDLGFTIQSGEVTNHFFRQGKVAAHWSLRSGARPRLIAAFPAGNSGAGLWFEDISAGVHLASPGGPRAAVINGSHGITAFVRSDAVKLTSRRILLGGLRFLRQYEDNGPLPTELTATLTATATGVRLQRTSFDLQNEYSLTVTPGAGTKLTIDPLTNALILERLPGSAELNFELTALTSEKALTPMPLAKLLRRAPSSPEEWEMARALAFLTYEEKLLAGSWRFLTYFGRDTLMAVYLLKPVLSPDAFEAALTAVFERLSPEGHVAHEEDLGDWAAWRRSLTQRIPLAVRADPIYDYKMVDSDFLLPVVAAAYLLDSANNEARTREFLQRRTADGRLFKDILLSNLRLVLAQASGYADAPTFNHLIRLHPGEMVGDWRDSNEGLGGGVYPYSVNVAFVPAALAAIEKISHLSLFNDDSAGNMGTAAARMALVWRGAGRHFQITLGPSEARAAALAFQRDLGLGLGDPEANLPTTGRSFPALALTQGGEPVAVMHTDEGFNLLFNDPPVSDLVQALDVVRQSFPLGLRTPVGLVVANPAFTATAALWHSFTRSHYHGTVVWSWQQAVYLSGLRRQALRRDLPGPLQQEIQAAAEHLAELVALAPSGGREELWTFRIDNGSYQPVPFGADRGDRTEANPVQLWSTVFLGMNLGAEPDASTR